MFDVFICHSPSNRELAAAIAARLERGAEARVLLEECNSDAGKTVASAWEAGTACGAILLLLSPDSVPHRLSRTDWEPVLRHVEGNAPPPLGAVLVSGCPYPRLLERKHFFRWDAERRETLRAIERWVLGIHLENQPAAFVPARLAWFEGREHELETMWESLVDEAGSVVVTNATAGSGKTSLAQEFARAASGHFRDIAWVGCGDRSRASLVADLGRQLGVPIEGTTEEVAARIQHVLEEHRLLVVLDDLTGEAPVLTSPGARTSVLITTRSRMVEVPPHARVLEIGRALQPVLIRLLADSAERRLWEAMSVCRQHAFALDLAARIANMGADEAGEASRRLVEECWIDPFDAAGARFRAGAGRLAATPPGADYAALHRRHAETLNGIFSKWRTEPGLCAGYLAEWEAAFQWALGSDWRLAIGLAERAFAFLRHQWRWPEAVRIYRQLLHAAGERQDRQVAERCAWELSWIADEYGRIRRPPGEGGQLAFDW